MSGNVYTEEELKGLLQSLYQEKRKVRALQEKVQKIGLERNTLKGKLSDKEVALGGEELEASLSQLQQEKDAQARQWKQEASETLEVKQRLSQIKKEREALEDQLKQKESQVSKLSKELETKQKQLDVANHGLEELKKNLKQSDKTDVSGIALKSLEAKCNQITEEKLQLEKAIQTIKSELSKKANSLVDYFTHEKEQFLDKLEEQEGRIELLSNQLLSQQIAHYFQGNRATLLRNQSLLMQKEIEIREGKIQKLRHANTEQQGQLEKLQVLFQREKEGNQRLQKAQKALLEQKKFLNERLSNSLHALQSVQKYLSLIEQKLDPNNSRDPNWIESLKTTLQQAQENIGSLKYSSKQDSSAQALKFEALLKKTVAILEQKTALLKSRESTLKQVLVAYQNLQKKSHKDRQAIEGLEKRLEDLEVFRGRFEEAQQNLSDLEQNLADFEAKEILYKREILEYKERVSILQREVGEKQELQKQIEELKQALNDKHHEELETVQNLRTQIRKEQDSLCTKIEKLEADKQELKALVERSKTAREEAQEELRVTKEKVALTRQALSRREEEIKETQEELKQWQEKSQSIPDSSPVKLKELRKQLRNLKQVLLKGIKKSKDLEEKFIQQTREKMRLEERLRGAKRASLSDAEELAYELEILKERFAQERAENAERLVEAKRHKEEAEHHFEKLEKDAFLRSNLLNELEQKQQDYASLEKKYRHLQQALEEAEERADAEERAKRQLERKQEEVLDHLKASKDRIADLEGLRDEKRSLERNLRAKNEEIAHLNKQFDLAQQEKEELRELVKTLRVENESQGAQLADSKEKLSSFESLQESYTNLYRDSKESEKKLHEIEIQKEALFEERTRFAKRVSELQNLYDDAQDHTEELNQELRKLNEQLQEECTKREQLEAEKEELYAGLQEEKEQSNKRETFLHTVQEQEVKLNETIDELEQKLHQKDIKLKKSLQHLAKKLKETTALHDWAEKQKAKGIEILQELEVKQGKIQELQRALDTEHEKRTKFIKASEVSLDERKRRIDKLEAQVKEQAVQLKEHEALKERYKSLSATFEQLRNLMGGGKLPEMPQEMEVISTAPSWDQAPLERPKGEIKTESDLFSGKASSLQSSKDNLF